MNDFLSLFLFVAVISFSEGLICRYGGYCLTTSDCVAGAQCQITVVLDTHSAFQSLQPIALLNMVPVEVCIFYF